MEINESFAAIVAGERLTMDQYLRRNEILAFLVKFFTENACCGKTPNWKKKLYSMKLSELEEKFEKMFKRKY